jgi:aspartate dehydrogenase
MLNNPQGTEQLMEEDLHISCYDSDIPVIDEDQYKSRSTVELGKKQPSPMILGIIGCGAIASIITDFALEGKLSAELKYFYDTDLDRARELASKVDGMVVLNFEDMLNNVDLVIEAASPQAVIKYVPKILRAGKDVIIMSIGALIGQNFREKLEKIASMNHCNIHTPSGAIVGLDGIKAASMGKITNISLLTRKPPESLGISTDEEIVLYEGKAHDAVRKFPMNMNVAAALSIACKKEVNVKIIADPSVDCNCHEIHVTGEFGELTTTTRNVNCTNNPKTSKLAAYSAIQLIKNLNNQINVGT